MADTEIEFGLTVGSPAIEPVTLDEAKVHLRVTHTSEDDLISTYISAARRACEQRTRRAFITETLLYTLARFPSCDGGRILLPRPPLKTLTSVKYRAASGATLTTLAVNTDYIVSTAREPAAIYPAYGTVWPTPIEQIESVQVAYTAGYGDTAALVPADIRAAVLLMTAHLYANREPVATGTIATSIPMTVDALLSPYVVHWSQ